MRVRSFVWSLLLFAVFMLQACSGGGGSSALLPTGAVDVSLTDGPGDFDKVYVTVRDIWFHQDGAAGPAAPGWLRFPLAAPVTVDLLTLSNGVVGSPVWKDLNLPAGTYRQLRLVLAPTEATLTGSAGGLNLQYNNEVQIGSSEYPLRVPAARLGIVLTGDFTVNAAAKLKLAIDFDAGHDIVEIERNGNTEYILKPRLAFFDLDDAGAITGSIDLASASTNSTSRFVIKAEQVDDPQNPKYRAVRRWTVVNRLNGNFVLYPLKPGNYDIVIRGNGHETVIVRGVPVTRGTTPASGATTLPLITLTARSGYPVDGSITFPTGAWVDFYQTLQDDPVPYEVRFRHFNPMTGKFPAFTLPTGQVHVAEFVSNGVISGPTATDPAEGAGNFRAAAGAILFSSATYTANGSDMVTSGTTTVTFGSLSPKAPPSVVAGNGISGMITKPTSTFAADLDKGILFVAQGGMIVHTMPIDLQMNGGGGMYTVSGLPGGSPANPLPFAFYGVDALAWSSLTPAKAVAIPAAADLRTGDDTGVDMNMLMLP